MVREFFILKLSNQYIVSQKNKNKTNIIIGLVLSVIFLTAFFITFPYPVKEVVEPTIDLPPAEQKPMTREEQIEQLQQQISEDKNNKLYETAINTQNRDFCNGISSESLRNTCISKTPEPEPVDPNIVVKSTDEKLYDTAIATQNGDLCSSIKDTTIRTNCINTIQVTTTTQTTTTPTLSTDEKLYNTAIALGESSLCNSIKDAALKNKCLEELN